MLISVVIPVFNEQNTLPILLRKVPEALRGRTWEIVFVNDGSRDASADILQEAAENDPRLKVLTFTRNFGHQAAITAGLDFADGDAVVVMDGDMQDPPELLPEMIELFERGYDVVSAQRVSRNGDTAFKRWSARLFYAIMRRLVDRRLVPEVGDFRLYSRRVVLALRELREQHRFMRGLVAWLGFEEAIVPFHRQARLGGETKYPLRKMLAFAWTAVTSFSALPLRLTSAVGAFVSVAGLLCLLYVLHAALITGRVVPGWASLMTVQCIFSGMTLLALGLVGEYIARTYEETKRRPLYLLRDSLNVGARWVPNTAYCPPSGKLASARSTLANRP